mmetsp:Transcript_15159/g.22704  ORF Transcript_15159/g.22704 Transcript_15159/m.22704 type:complete len:121 (+) Transcript_15159:512-874(+)
MMTAANRFGLYSAFRAFNAIVFKSKLHPKFTVDTIFCKIGWSSTGGASLNISSSVIVPSSGVIIFPVFVVVVVVVVELLEEDPIELDEFVTSIGVVFDVYGSVALKPKFIGVLFLLLIFY